MFDSAETNPGKLNVYLSVRTVLDAHPPLETLFKLTEDIIHQPGGHLMSPSVSCDVLVDQSLLLETVITGLRKQWQVNPKYFLPK